MTDELQTEAIDDGIVIDDDHVENEEVNQELSETAEGGAELATAQEETPDKIDDGVQKAINKQHAKYREEERKRIQAEDEAGKLREKLEKLEAEKSVVDIPAIPDPYDDNYEEQLRIRDEAIMRKATQDAQQQSVIAQQDAQKEVAQKAEQERLNTLVSGYDGQIAKLGLNPEEVRVAGDKVVEYGISADLAEFILQQEDGPLITQYLSKNPVALDDLRHMSVIDGAFKVSSDIRKAASTLKPQASQTPDPTETLTGRGAGEKVSPFIAKATFD